MKRLLLSIVLGVLLISYAVVASASGTSAIAPQRTYLPYITKPVIVPTATPAPLPTATPAPTAPSFEDRVVVLINQQRAAHGCGALNISVQLTNAAEAHSLDMAMNNYFSHTGLNGSTPTTRAQAAGYPFGTGENIAAGQTTPESVVNEWMKSTGHRANILNCSYKSTGVGYVYQADDTYGPYRHYWTQMFGLQ